MNYISDHKQISMENALLIKQAIFGIIILNIPDWLVSFSEYASVGSKLLAFAWFGSLWFKVWRDKKNAKKNENQD